ncbi:hypothetical protein DFH06DRAFT_1247177 [Mycena polygramma]|nr:hypothetical protein DFH06DRAFT_1247829 [Mycena polygramma]KAJ7609325.1 hypothetical protein DFH06DRAFT_1247177 [Mycena polygramma]
MSQASRSPTPTPFSPFHDILNLTQQLTPSKSPHTLRRIRRQLQLQANDAQQEHVNLKRRAVDAEHQNDATRKPKKKRRRGDRARDVNDPELDAQAVEARIRQAGRCFAVQKALFVNDDAVFDTKPADDFDFDREFASSQNELQGQIRDILAVLPDSVRPKIDQEWVQDSFLDGMQGQRSSIHYRLRTEALPSLVDDPKQLDTSASRFDNFAQRIGYKPGTAGSAPSWSRWAVPILYDEWDGKVDVDHLFRGDMPIMVFVSVVRGPKGAKGLFEGLSKLPQARCLERIHKITRATPCVISIGSILTIWLFSPDTQLLRVGDETKIDYARRHRLYVRRIREGLRDKKAWAISLLEYWNRILFPNADESSRGDAAGYEPEEEDDLDDIFDQAPAVAEPQAASRDDDDDHDDDDQRRADIRTNQRASPSSPSPPQRSQLASGSARHPPRAQPAQSSQAAPRTGAQSTSHRRMESFGDYRVR